MTDTEYPETQLDRDWEIKRAFNNTIILEDQSVWKLTAVFALNRRGVDNWQPGQIVNISRSPGRSNDIRPYKVKNKETGVTLTGTFEGWER